MPIIIKSRKGHGSYTEYDLEDAHALKKLKRRIKDLASEMRKSKDPQKIAYKKACLHFIAITLHQAHQPANLSVKEVWEVLRDHVELPSPEQLASDPESLFLPPQPALTQKKARALTRKKTGYEKNLTPALRTLSGPIVLIKPLIEVLEDHAKDIREHACRRTELFFLLCLALYKTKAPLALADTVKQHGKATKGSGYVACHSSLFTGIAITAGVNILEGTHLNEVLNETIELPLSVNKFDSFCEGQNRKTSHGLRMQLLPTLQKVSEGTLSPIEAIADFFLKMRRFFDGKAVEYVEKSSVNTPETAKQRILELEAEGTFYWSSDSEKAPSAHALSAWMRASHSTCALLLAKPLVAEAMYERKKAEILSSPHHYIRD